MTNFEISFFWQPWNCKATRRWNSIENGKYRTFFSENSPWLDRMYYCHIFSNNYPKISGLFFIVLIFESWMKDFPPEEMEAQRYGNKAYRKWYDKFSQVEYLLLLFLRNNKLRAWTRCSKTCCLRKCARLWSSWRPICWMRSEIRPESIMDQVIFAVNFLV